MTKPPTPQGISALLRKAGFLKSVPLRRAEHAARIRHDCRTGRGPKMTSGFRVTSQDGRVTVAFWNEWTQARAADAGALLFYREKIIAAGWDAQYGDRQYSHLIVTAPESTEGETR